jgi:hypothetical protein
MMLKYISSQYSRTIFGNHGPSVTSWLSAIAGTGNPMSGGLSLVFFLYGEILKAAATTGPGTVEPVAVHP